MNDNARLQMRSMQSLNYEQRRLCIELKPE